MAAQISFPVAARWLDCAPSHFQRGGSADPRMPSLLPPLQSLLEGVLSAAASLRSAHGALQPAAAASAAAPAGPSHPKARCPTAFSLGRESRRHCYEQKPTRWGTLFDVYILVHGKCWPKLVVRRGWAVAPAARGRPAAARRRTHVSAVREELRCWSLPASTVRRAPPSRRRAVCDCSASMAMAQITTSAHCSCAICSWRSVSMWRVISLRPVRSRCARATAAPALQLRRQRRPSALFFSPLPSERFPTDRPQRIAAQVPAQSPALEHFSEGPFMTWFDMPWEDRATATVSSLSGIGPRLLRSTGRRGGSLHESLCRIMRCVQAKRAEARREHTGSTQGARKKHAKGQYPVLIPLTNTLP